MSGFFRQVFCHGLKQSGTRVKGLVHTVTKAHDLLFTLKFLFGESYSVGIITLFLQLKQGIHNRCVGATVQWTFKSSNSSGDGRVHIRLSSSNGTGCEGGSIHAVFCVKYQAEIHGLLSLLTRFLAIQHVKKVISRAAFLKWSHDIFTMTNTIKCGYNSWDLGCDGYGLSFKKSRIIFAFGVVKISQH